MKFSLFPSPRLAFVSVLAVTIAAGFRPSFAQTKPSVTPSNVQLLDKALDKAPDSPRVVVDDMVFPRAKFLAYRNRVAQTGGRQLRSAFYEVARWPGGNVPYVLDAGLPTAQQSTFLEACREWEKWANVNFIARTSESNYVRVYQDSSGSSFSYVGMIGGAQDLSLATWATKWSACHEVGHALGVVHEQCRSDRDNYVTINFANIIKGMEGNFAIVSNTINKGSYDFDSLMHYNSTAFASAAGQSTIVANSAYSQYQSLMGQRDHLSTLDKSGMAAMYGAPLSGPTNDLFAQAAVLSGASGAVMGTNLGATKETGESNHAGDDGTATVWYKWTAPSSGTATFSTEGSAFDTTLAVYTGASVSSLKNVASGNNISATDLTSSLSFNAVAGTTYSIVVNGFKSGSNPTATGEIALKWNLAATYSLSGKATLSGGSALPGVTLSLTGMKTGTTTSATGGAYSFAALATGTYTVTPSKSGYIFSPTSRQITVSDHVSGVSFVATPSGAKPTIYASISSVTNVEGHAGSPYMTFNVALSEPSSGTVTVNYATVNGTALAGSDYTTKSGTLTFTAGSTMAEIRVSILPDRIQEANETFLVVLSNAVGVTLKTSTGKGTIVNDDAANDAAPNAANDWVGSFTPSALQG